MIYSPLLNKTFHSRPYILKHVKFIALLCALRYSERASKRLNGMQMLTAQWRRPGLLPCRLKILSGPVLHCLLDRENDAKEHAPTPGLSTLMCHTSIACPQFFKLRMLAMELLLVKVSYLSRFSVAAAALLRGSHIAASVTRATAARCISIHSCACTAEFCSF